MLAININCFDNRLHFHCITTFHFCTCLFVKPLYLWNLKLWESLYLITISIPLSIFTYSSCSWSSLKIQPLYKMGRSKMSTLKWIYLLSPLPTLSPQIKETYFYHILCLTCSLYSIPCSWSPTLELLNHLLSSICPQTVTWLLKKLLLPCIFVPSA